MYYFPADSIDIKFLMANFFKMPLSLPILGGDASNQADVEDFNTKLDYWIKSLALMNVHRDAINALSARMSKRLPPVWKGLSGLVGCLNEAMKAPADISKIVAEYFYQPLEVQLSMTVAEALQYKDNLEKQFEITGCDYVSFVFPTTTLTMTFDDFLQVFAELIPIYEDAKTNGIHLATDVLNVQFHGTISEIKITAQTNLYAVTSFPTSSPLTKIDFSFCSNLRSVPSELPATVRNLQDCFVKTKNPIGLSNWRTENVLKFDNMFNNSGINQPLPWDISSAISTNGMFATANNFNKKVCFNCPNLVTANNMFEGTTNMKESVVMCAPKLQNFNSFCNYQSVNDGKIVLIAGKDLYLGNFQRLLSYSKHEQYFKSKMREDPLFTPPQNPNKWMPCIISMEDFQASGVALHEIASKLWVEEANIFPNCHDVKPSIPDPYIVDFINRYGRRKTELVVLDSQDELYIKRSTGVRVSNVYLEQQCDKVRMRYTLAEMKKLEEANIQLKALIDAKIALDSKSWDYLYQ